MKAIKNWFSVTENRAYVYRVIVALSTVAVAYGVISETEVTVLLGAIAAVLGTTLAAANTSTDPTDNEGV